MLNVLNRDVGIVTRSCRLLIYRALIGMRERINYSLHPRRAHGARATSPRARISSVNKFAVWLGILPGCC